MTPTAVFDGTLTTLPYTSWPNLFANRKKVASPLNLRLKITAAGDNFSLRATMTRKGSMANTGLRLYCAVTEQNLSHSGNTYHHVLRKMYPNATGTPFTINDNETKAVTVAGALGGGWVKNNLHFVVWVQNFSAKAVYQAKLATWSEVAVEPSSVGRVKALFR